MKVEQRALTLLVPLRSGQTVGARNTLTAIARNLQHHPTLRLHKSRSTHFARFVVVEVAHCPQDRLLFTSNYDGPEDEYLLELIRTCGAGLDQIFQHCEGYKPGTALSAPRFRAFVARYSLAPIIFFPSLPGLTAEAIRNDGRTRTIVEDLIDNAGSRTIGRLWRLSGAKPRPHAPRAAMGPFQKKLFRCIQRFVEWLVGVRHDGANPNVIAPTAGPRFADRELQNEMTIVAPVKDSWFHRCVLKLVLFFGSFTVKDPWGSLSGVTSIHFARWHILDRGRTIFFESNYDGSWDSYLDNFVDVTSPGLNNIWGNCEGYPLRGCQDIEAFKAIIRRHQLEAQIYYRAYPDLSVQNIIANHAVSSAMKAFLGTPDIGRVSAGFYEIND